MVRSNTSALRTAAPAPGPRIEWRQRLEQLPAVAAQVIPGGRIGGDDRRLAPLQPPYDRDTEAMLSK
jgi:hypothetical protein